MRLLPLLASLIFPACAAPGTAGLSAPPPPRPLAIVRPATPNSALAAPVGFTPAPDIATPLYPMPAARLFAAITAIAAGEPRTFLQRTDPADWQSNYVVRSRIFNFPDLVLVAVEPRGTARSALILYSRSLYGYSDLGVNRARVRAWLAALERRLAAPQ